MNKILLFLLLAFFVSGCNEKEAVENWIKNTDTLRTNAKKNAAIVPYRNEQHQILKAYFNEIIQMALAVKKDEKLIEALNEVVAESDLQKICPKILISRREWQAIIKNCTKNRYFLCSEEVRAYPDIVAAVRGLLNADHQSKFDKAEACKSAL